MERLPNKILQSMFDNKKHSDIQLIAGADGKKISAHKNVLSNATEYFDLMLNGSFREAAESEVLIPDIESDVLEAVIEFIYCGSVEIWDYGAAIQLLKTSHLMKIPELLNYSSDFLNQHISAEIALEVYLLAKRFGLEDLVNYVTNSILKDLKIISKQEEFKQLDKESLVEIINARKSFTFEDDIAEAVLIWMGEEKERLPYFKELLKILKINHLDHEDILHDLLKKCNDKEETAFILNELKRPKQSNDSDRKSKLIAIKCDSSEYRIYEYDCETNGISSEYKVYDYGRIMGIWDEKIIFILSSMITVFDIQKRAVSPPINCSLNSHYMTSGNQFKIGNHIYMIYDNNCVKLRLWDFQSETITLPANEDKLYIIDALCEFGGELKIAAYKKENPNICVIISYNPISNTWDFGPEVYVKFKNEHNGSMVAHEDCLYYFKRELLHIYKPYEKIWCCPIIIKQLIRVVNHTTFYDIIKQAYSINGQLIVRSNKNELFKYSDGQLTKLSVDGGNCNILHIFAK